MMRSKLSVIAFCLMIAPVLCWADTPLSQFLKEAGIEGSAADAEIDPKKTSADEAERAFGSVLRTALARGLKPKNEHFDNIVRILGIPTLKKGEIVRDVLVDGETGFRSLLIRVRKDGSHDVIIVSSWQEEGINRGLFYVTSSEGRLVDTFFVQKGVRPARVDSRHYVNAHKAEIEFWRKWEKQVHRQTAGGRHEAEPAVAE